MTTNAPEPDLDQIVFGKQANPYSVRGKEAKVICQNWWNRRGLLPESVLDTIGAKFAQVFLHQGNGTASEANLSQLALLDREWLAEELAMLTEKEVDRKVTDAFWHPVLRLLNQPPAKFPGAKGEAVTPDEDPRFHLSIEEQIHILMLQGARSVKGALQLVRHLGRPDLCESAEVGILDLLASLLPERI